MPPRAASWPGTKKRDGNENRQFLNTKIIFLQFTQCSVVFTWKKLFLLNMNKYNTINKIIQIKHKD